MDLFLCQAMRRMVGLQAAVWPRAPTSKLRGSLHCTVQRSVRLVKERMRCVMAAVAGLARTSDMSL